MENQCVSFRLVKTRRDVPKERVDEGQIDRTWNARRLRRFSRHPLSSRYSFDHSHFEKLRGSCEKFPPFLSLSPPFRGMGLRFTSLHAKEDW